MSRTEGARNGALVRVLAIRRELWDMPYAPPLDVLARRHGVSTRTIRRDLEALEKAGELTARWRDNRHG